MSFSAIAKRGEPPTEGSRHSPRLRTILIVAALSAVYLLAVWDNLAEVGCLSLRLEIPSEGADYLLMEVNVAHVDLLRSELKARTAFHLVGHLAEDEVTPATDLRLVLNSVHGQQQFNFARGQRIDLNEAVSPPGGEVNFYPLDSYEGVLWLP